MDLKEQIAKNCDISEQDAEKELDCAIENFHATMEQGYTLTYSEIADKMAGLGIELDDANLEELINRLMY